MIRILIADDHPIVRDGIKSILSEAFDEVVADEVSTSQGVLDRVWSRDYDVVLLDISMPGRSGMEVLKLLNRDKPELPVLVLSMHPEEQYAIRVLKAGAAGYLTKESASDELITAIRKVIQGRKYVNSSLAETLALYIESNIKGYPHETLSDREYEVMCLIASGKSIKEIAGELDLSSKTISTYRGRILEKMKMKTNSEITYYAIQKGLVE